MKNIKKIIIILLILMVIIVISIISILFMLNDEENPIIGNGKGDSGEEVEYNISNIEDVTDSEKYFSVINCINIYLSQINKENAITYERDENDEYIEVNNQAQANQKMYNVLSKSYIEKNNITVENINQKIETLDDNVIFIPLEMKVIENLNLDNYLVHGSITTIQNKYIKDVYLIIYLDKENKIFSVEPLNNNYNSIEDITFTYTEEKIEKNSENIYTSQVPNDEKISKEYFTLIKNLLLSRPDVAYSRLDEQYSQNKFGNYNEFINFINSRINDISKANISQYKVEHYMDYSEYILKDKKGYIYILNKVNPLDYTLMFDTYTIDTPEFIEKYNSVNTENKISLNIGKIVDAINDKDYKYIYNKLDENYKNNNFNNINTFENYILNNFYNKNTIQGMTYTVDGNVYISKLQINNSENSAEQKDVTIMIKLLENRNFVISFPI